MKSESIKTLIINLAIGVLVVSILYVGYASLKKDDKLNEPSQGSATSLQAEAVLTSMEVTRTFNEFDNLKRSVANSVAVFTLPAFQDMQDYSIEVSPEQVGRVNPFGQTDWKARMDAKAK